MKLVIKFIMINNIFIKTLKNNRFFLFLMDEKTKYDVIIVGGGCAGLTAAIYCARYKLSTLVLTKENGGMLNEAHKVENFPGFKSISGFELMKKQFEHANSFDDVDIIQEEVKRIEKKDSFKVITEKNSYESKTVILALGLERRKLNIKGEKEFLGRGVSYCATCDAAFYKDMVVSVVGGNDSAAQAALLLSEFSKKVYIVYRREKMRCEPILLDKIEKNKKIEFIYKTNVIEIKGTDFVEELIFDTGNKISVDGIFIEAGYIPVNYLLNELKIDVDEKGYIIIDEKAQTNIEGLYAAGDITDRPVKQAIVASGYGAIAANSAYHHIK